MLPHKTARGTEALKRLKVFEGIPPPYDRVKRQVAPEALRYLRLTPGRRYTVLGRLAKEVGWKYSEVVTRLEEKRKVRANAFYLRAKAIKQLRAKAESQTSGDLKSVNEAIAQFGH